MQPVKIKLRKFNSRYLYSHAGRIGKSSAAWIPYGHPLLETPPPYQEAISTSQALAWNSSSSTPYSGLLLNQSMLADSGEIVWTWKLVEPRDELCLSVIKPLSLHTRRIVASGITEQVFRTRREALEALAGALDLLS